MKTKIILNLFIIIMLTGCAGSDSSTPTDTSGGGSESDADDNQVEIARTVTIDPIDYASGGTIASSYFKFSADAPENEALLPFLSGTLDGDYVGNELEDSAISFTVEVPDDPDTYGSAAGSDVSYVGYILYPTILDTDYVAPAGISGWTVPSDIAQMEETVDAAPVFADDTYKYPLIVYSHGLGGEVLSNIQWLRQIPAHGYALLALFHGDQRFHPYGGDTYSPEEITLRPLAVKKVIDYLDNDANKYHSHIDFNRIGVVGTSYGGATAFLTIGAKPIDARSDVGDVLAQTVSDIRVKAAVGIVPYMGDSQHFPIVGETLVTFFGYNSIGATPLNAPFLAISGTSDVTAEEAYIKNALSKTEANNHLVSMVGVEHNLTADGAGQTVFTWTLHFLNYHLQNDTTFLSIKDVDGDPVDSIIAY